MIRDILPFTDLEAEGGRTLAAGAVEAFVQMLERKLGAMMVYDRRTIPFGRHDLIEPLRIAALLERAGIVTSFGPIASLPDEPPFKNWYAAYSDNSLIGGGGAAVESDEAALYAALAEALERYIWTSCTDYFRNALRASATEIGRRGPFVGPERFVGFSPEQGKLHANADTKLTWIAGHSLSTGKKTFVPAQTVTPHSGNGEPLIREIVTHGLATWPTRDGARLAGALELIERDAFMIMWWNQLTLPRADLGRLRRQSVSLDALIARCERYRLKVHIIQMITDAPAHAFCAVIEDLSGHAPRFVPGLRAHRSSVRAAEKAVLEALRARQLYRTYFAHGGTWDPDVPAEKIYHFDRAYWWGVGDRSRALEFLVSGGEREIEPAPWEHDTDESHLERVAHWCRDSGYECVAVPLGISKKNPTRWHIEMTIIPELEWMHLRETLQSLGGTRWRTIPEKFGYAPRARQRTDVPHPFT